jgi:glycosyltransferase involved in cell wall biosynthesis
VLERITPVVLTYNEAPNLARCLERLRWAREVLVVDSFSTDATLDIAARYPNVRVVQRAFDDFEHQLNHALDACGVDSEWVLVLDADYVVTEAVVDELRHLEPPRGVDGYRARFVYCVDGRPLRGSLYPPVTVLLRRGHARYYQDGHAYRVRVEGEVRELSASMQHDDRKPLSRWYRSQLGYARQEARKLLRTPLAQLGWPDRVRRVPFASVPLAVGYCLLYRGCLLDGRAGLFYAAQRGVAESLISLAQLRELAR